jgi:hypothetical protein
MLVKTFKNLCRVGKRWLLSLMMQIYAATVRAPASARRRCGVQENGERSGEALNFWVEYIIPVITHLFLPTDTEARSKVEAQIGITYPKKSGAPGPLNLHRE